MLDAAQEEFLSWASKLTQEDGAIISQLHAERGPAGVIQALSQTGRLSDGALQVAAATLDECGYQGTVERVQGLLREVATTNQINHFAQSPEMQQRAQKWLTDNGVQLDPKSSPVHQAGRIHVAAQAQNVDPTALAKHLAKMADPAEAAAEAERQKGAKDAEKNEALAGRRLQGILQQPEFHKAAAGVGMNGRDFMRELVKYADKPEAASERFPGLFKDADEARELLGEIAAAEANDIFLDRMIAKDGSPAKPEKPASDTWRAHLEAASAKFTPKAPPQRPVSDAEKAARGQDLKPGTTAETDSSWRYHLETAHRKLTGESLAGIEAAPHVRAEVARGVARDLRAQASGGDDWRSHLSAAYDRIEAAKHGDAAVAEYDSLRSGALETAHNLESTARDAEREAT